MSGFPAGVGGGGSYGQDDFSKEAILLSAGDREKGLRCWGPLVSSVSGPEVMFLFLDRRHLSDLYLPVAFLTEPVPHFFAVNLFSASLTLYAVVLLLWLVPLLNSTMRRWWWGWVDWRRGS